MGLYKISTNHLVRIHFTINIWGGVFCGVAVAPQNIFLEKFADVGKKQAICDKFELKFAYRYLIGGTIRGIFSELFNPNKKPNRFSLLGFVLEGVCCCNSWLMLLLVFIIVVLQSQRF